MKTVMIYFFLGLMAAIFGKAQANGGYSVKFQFRSNDGCYANTNPSYTDFYEQCAELRCEELAIIGKGYVCESDNRCDDSYFKKEVYTPCVEEAEGYFQANQFCSPGEYGDSDVIADVVKLGHGFFIKRCAQEMAQIIPGNTGNYYESYCRSLLVSNGKNYGKLLMSMVVEAENNIDHHFTGFEATCQTSDSGLLDATLTFADGTKHKINLWSPQDRRYENGCFGRLPKLKSDYITYYDLESYAPVPYMSQKLGWKGMSFSEDTTVPEKWQEGFAMLNHIFSYGGMANSKSFYNFSRDNWEEKHCDGLGMCGKKRTEFRVKWETLDNGKLMMIPGLGPKTTPRICASLRTAAESCWKTHKDSMLMAVTSLEMIGLFSGATVAMKAGSIAPKIKKVGKKPGKPKQGPPKAIKTPGRRWSYKSYKKVKSALEKRFGKAKMKELFPCLK